MPTLARTGSVVFLAVLIGVAGAEAQVVVPPGDAYVVDSGAADGGAAARWRIDGADARVLRVHFAAPPPGRPDFWREARRALRTWSEVPGLPIRFTFTDRASDADLDFRWIPSFETAQAGSTHRDIGEPGTIEHVTITLAHTHSDGVPMSDEFLRLVALHEVGHAVGLPHSDDPGDAMHPGNRNLVLSSRDVRSVHVLYGYSETSDGSSRP